MEFVSVFDIFKIGVGPSSSHTLGPWKAATKFIEFCKKNGFIVEGAHIYVNLYGSLSLTGKGHATDLAVVMGLAGYDPVTVDTGAINSIITDIQSVKKLSIDGVNIQFNPEEDIVFLRTFLDYHANGMRFYIDTPDGQHFTQTYYSIGGGFIHLEGFDGDERLETSEYPYPIEYGRELLKYCRETGKKISEIVLLNELADRTQEEIKSKLLQIWNVMLESVYNGSHTGGILPGILKVKRRAPEVYQKLNPNSAPYSNKEEWLETIRQFKPDFQEILKWTSNFAIAVNETNASLGRVVTSPTNGSAGVIPAVMMYYLCFVNKEAGEKEILDFLMTCSEIGSIFKKNSTFSAAMGGCQAEIGVSSAMAAAGLAEMLGATPEQCTIAAEIAMEHHLGMTCDPIAGLVQIPCIERNSMGAIKAINAAIIALDRNPEDVKVSLDDVVATMWETAKSMDRRYKETSEGGLAVTVNIVDC